MSGFKLKDQILNDVWEAEMKRQEQNFGNTKGEQFNISPDSIDYSKIDGYHNGGQIYERGKGWGGSKENAANVATELLNSNEIKHKNDSGFSPRTWKVIKFVYIVLGIVFLYLIYSVFG